MILIEVEIRGRRNKRRQEGHSQVLELAESQDEESRDDVPPSLRPGSLWPGRGRAQKETLRQGTESVGRNNSVSHALLRSPEPVTNVPTNACIFASTLSL